MLVLGRRDVAELLPLRELLDVLAEGFRAYSTGRASAPPRVGARAPAGLLGAMPGWVEGAGLALKAVSVFPDNTDRPSHQGLIALFDDTTGAPLALLDGEHITAMRTAGGAAVSARLLARADATTLAILGAGVQGRAHLATLPLVRDITRIRVASRNPAHAAELASTDPRCTVAGGFEEAVRGADVVCCCTDAREPVVRFDWLAPGTHVTSVGGTFGPELDPGILERSRVFVEWRGAATAPPPAGAHELSGSDPTALTELGDVLTGARPGRRDESEVTVYKSTGFAVEDVVAARLVYERALAAGAGVTVEL